MERTFRIRVMPYRTTPLITGEIYHIFNRSVAGQPIFSGNKYYQRALETLDFYRFLRPSLRFSHYNRLTPEGRIIFLENLKTKGTKQVDFFAYCLMPNHFHFLIKEVKELGTQTFLRNFQDSYARYFNVKNERSGSLFQLMFKAVRIETEEQLLHVTRYIHLNPLSTYVLRNASDLETYPWSSFSEYIGKQKANIVEKEFILGFFPSVESFKKFTMDRVDYQRELEKIKHLILE